MAADDIAETISFFEDDSGGDGAISNFGGLNPIYDLGDSIEISAGYLASPANEATEEGGIFNAPYGAIALSELILPIYATNLKMQVCPQIVLEQFMEWVIVCVEILTLPTHECGGFLVHRQSLPKQGKPQHGR